LYLQLIQFALGVGEGFFIEVGDNQLRALFQPLPLCLHVFDIHADFRFRFSIDSCQQFVIQVGGVEQRRLHRLDDRLLHRLDPPLSSTRPDLIQPCWRMETERMDCLSTFRACVLIVRHCRWKSARLSYRLTA